MDEEQYQNILAGLHSSMISFPNCRVASCDCDEKGKGEWISGCKCLGHFAEMDAEFGKKNWTLADFTKRGAGIDGHTESTT